MGRTVPLLERGICRKNLHPILSADDLFLSTDQKGSVRCRKCYTGQLEARRAERQRLRGDRPQKTTLLAVGSCRRGGHIISSLSDTRRAGNGYRQCKKCYENSQIRLKELRRKDRINGTFRSLLDGRCRKGHSVASISDIYINPSTGWGHCRRCRKESNQKIWDRKKAEKTESTATSLLDRGWCRKTIHRITGPDDLTGGKTSGRCKKCRIVAARKRNGTPLDLPFDTENQGRSGRQKKEKAIFASCTQHSGGLFEVTLHCTHPLLFRKGSLPKKGEKLYCSRCADWSEAI